MPLHIVPLSNLMYKRCRIRLPTYLDIYATLFDKIYINPQIALSLPTQVSLPLFYSNPTITIAIITTI